MDFSFWIYNYITKKLKKKKLNKNNTFTQVLQNFERCLEEHNQKVKSNKITYFISVDLSKNERSSDSIFIETAQNIHIVYINQFTFHDLLIGIQIINE